MRVQLVHDRAMDVQAVQCVSISRQRLEAAGRLQLHNGLRRHIDAEPLPERLHLPSHRLRVAEDDPRLIARCGGRVDLCAGLAIQHRHVKTDRRRQTGIVRCDVPCGRQVAMIGGINLNALHGAAFYRIAPNNGPIVLQPSRLRTVTQPL